VLQTTTTDANKQNRTAPYTMCRRASNKEVAGSTSGHDADA